MSDTADKLKFLEAITVALMIGRPESDVLATATHSNGNRYSEPFLARFIGMAIRTPEDTTPQNSDLRNDQITKILWWLRNHNASHDCEHVNIEKLVIIETMVRTIHAGHGNRPQTTWIDDDPIYRTGCQVLSNLPFDPTRARNLISSRLSQKIEFHVEKCLVDGFTTRQVHVGEWCILFKRLLTSNNHVTVGESDPEDVADAWRLLESWILAEMALEKTV